MKINIVVSLKPSEAKNITKPKPLSNKNEKYRFTNLIIINNIVRKNINLFHFQPPPPSTQPCLPSRTFANL